MQTKKVTFACPHHGVLHESVEYISVDIGSKRLVDVSVMYCNRCKKYYTPFANLLAIVRVEYNGRKISASQAQVQKSFPKTEVRNPYFANIEDDNKRRAQLRLDEETERKQQEKLRKEKNKQYIESLRKVPHDSLILTNKPCFIDESKCPCCGNATKKEHVRIDQHQKSLLAHIRHCEKCNVDYITPGQFNSLDRKASEKIRGEIFWPFVRPRNVNYEYQQDDTYLFIPRKAIDFDKFSWHRLPPRVDEYYDMTDEEYLFLKTYYQPEVFPSELRQKSFLGEAGYSTGESVIRRRKILERCVNEHGKSRVLNQLKSNMNLRLKQRNGSVRYQHALNIWREDISYVENHL